MTAPRLVHAQRRLRQVRELRVRRERSGRSTSSGDLDERDALRSFAHRADDFVVPLVADEDDVIPLAGVLDRLQVDLGHQRAGGVDRPQVPAARRARRISGETPWALYSSIDPSGTSSRCVDEHHALLREPLDDVPVVDDLVVDVDARAEQPDGTRPGTRWPC